MSQIDSQSAQNFPPTFKSEEKPVMHASITPKMLYFCHISLFYPADPRGITYREVYQEFQPSDDLFHRSSAKGCSDHRFRARIPSLQCPIGNSV